MRRQTANVTSSVSTPDTVNAMLAEVRYALSALDDNALVQYDLILKKYSLITTNEIAKRNRNPACSVSVRPSSSSPSSSTSANVASTSRVVRSRTQREFYKPGETGVCADDYEDDSDDSLTKAVKQRQKLKQTGTLAVLSQQSTRQQTPLQQTALQQTPLQQTPLQQNPLQQTARQQTARQAKRKRSATAEEEDDDDESSSSEEETPEDRSFICEDSALPQAALYESDEHDSDGTETSESSFCNS